MEIDFDVDVEEFTQNDHLAAAAPKVAVDWSIFENPQIWINAADWIEKTDKLPEKDAYMLRKPKGVVAIIAPFNFPFAIAMIGIS